MAAFVKILLRANFDQANLKIDLNSQLWNKNITSVTSSGKNCLVSKNTFLKKVNVHLQTNVASTRSLLTLLPSLSAVGLS